MAAVAAATTPVMPLCLQAAMRLQQQTQQLVVGLQDHSLLCYSRGMTGLHWQQQQQQQMLTAAVMHTQATSQHWQQQQQVMMMIPLPQQ
jgi:hypothetical protein